MSDTWPEIPSYLPQPALDAREPSPERQAELHSAFEANIAAGNPPYRKVRIRSQGELIWIMKANKWSGELEMGHSSRPDLREADLRELDLSKMMLLHADLTGAILTRSRLSSCRLGHARLSRAWLLEADLSDAYLNEVDLSGARLTGANLSNADLEEADLSNANLALANLKNAKLNNTNLSRANLELVHAQGAEFRKANLREAVLQMAKLQGAEFTLSILMGTDFNEANLSGANMMLARMDVGTLLSGITLDEETRLGGISWNGTLLAVVDWTQVPVFGDEGNIKTAKGRDELESAYGDAAEAYRGIAIALRSQGLLDIAAIYRLRQERLERKALILQQKYLAAAFSWLLDLVAGYGERPGRAAWAYFAVVLSFTVAYFGIAHFDIDTRLRRVPWYEWPALSITSFHGRGFFPGSLPAHPWITVLALLEAVIGLFLELVFIAAFTRRFLGNG